jgi:hypothetical protein
MSIHHQTIVTCDQNPLPDRCRQRLHFDFGEAFVSDETERFVIERELTAKDWGVMDIKGRKAHYCPYHRPVR